MLREKVVTPKELARIEKIALSEGGSEEKFILLAGEAIAKKISELAPSKKIVLLSGKGNNAADGFAAGAALLKKGFQIRAFLFFPPSLFSNLCKKTFDSFKSLGGKCEEVSLLSDIFFEKDEIIVDAIFGTGFSGKIDPTISSFIEKINTYKNLKVAIDIPSGLDGDSGEVLTEAIKADRTIYLGLAKSGFFLKKGWDLVGEIHKVDFGLKKKYEDLAHPIFFLAKEDSIYDDLPKIDRMRNKYSAGFVAAIAGSVGMEGAANLSGKAALRSGAGIVKLFIYGYKGKTNEPMADELVKMELDLSKKEEILSVCNLASSIFIGPGIGRSEEMTDFLRFLLPKLKKPLVLDADGLNFLSKNLDCPLPENTVLTPHRQEMERLLSKKELSLNDLLEESKEFCDKRSVIIILKGAPTFILKKEEIPLIVTVGDPGMATAGSGDVLTGVVAALIAEGLDIYSAASLGAILHGIAGRGAAKEKTSYSMIASDIIEHLPEAFKKP